MRAENRRRKQGVEPPRLSVRRCLFGRPDPKETRKFLKEEMKKIDEQNCDKWSFNFAVGSPIRGGDFEWEPVNKTESPDVYTKLYKSVSRQYTPSRWSRQENSSKHVVPVIGAIMDDLSTSPSRPRQGSTVRRVLPMTNPTTVTSAPISEPQVHDAARISSTNRKMKATKRKQITIPGK